jgi:hypothetical protein
MGRLESAATLQPHSSQNGPAMVKEFVVQGLTNVDFNDDGNAAHRESGGSLESTRSRKMFRKVAGRVTAEIRGTQSRWSLEKEKLGKSLR